MTLSSETDQDTIVYYEAEFLRQSKVSYSVRLVCMTYSVFSREIQLVENTNSTNMQISNEA